MSENTVSVLFSVLRSVICGTPMSDAEKALVTEENLPKLMNLAVKHDMGHLVAYGLQSNQLVDGNSKIHQQTFLAVFRYEKLNYDLHQTCAALEKARIPFIPLKGSVLRKYYPEPWMRTSCDIDILVHESDLDAAVSCLENELGYTVKGKASHDISLFTPSGMHIELHYSLIESSVADKMDLPLQNVWEDAKPIDPSSCHYVLSNEMFYYYHIAHMAKHFLIGGCGIRPFLDIYLLKQHLTFDEEKKETLLSSGGMLKYAQQSEQLAAVWMENTAHTEITRKVESYILTGGIYGTTQNRVSAQQVYKGGKLKYALSRIWLPFEVLKYVYPVLEKKKWLFPICQVRRWFRLVFCGSLKSSVRELKYNSSTTKDEQKAIKVMLQQLDL